MATLCSKHPGLAEVQPTGSAPSSHSGPQFRSWPRLSGADAGNVPSGQLEGERGGAMASWAARSIGGGGSLRRTISRPAFDLGQGLPASKWSQLLLQAEANGQEGAGEEVGRFGG